MTERKTNKKERASFKVDDEKIFNLVQDLKKIKDITQVDMVTCFEIKVTWLSKTYTKEDVEALIAKTIR